MQTSIPLGISACVTGQPVRFNAGSAKMPPLLRALGDDFSLLPFCPELAAGMGVPREPVRLVNGDGRLQLAGVNSGEDWHDRLQAVAMDHAMLAASQQLRGFVVKSKSPSCGNGSAKRYNRHGVVDGKQDGVFTTVLKQQLLIPVVEAEQLNSPLVADRFLQQVMLADDFYRLPAELRARDLLELYSRYKLQVMASSPSHYRMAGRLLANMAGADLAGLRDQLYLLLFDALDRYSSRERHVNALMHIQGYFKKQLPARLKQEFVRLLEAYRQAHLPLSVPITMIRHYLLLYPNDYLQSQRYLQPYPDSYGLRNHL